MLAGGKRKEGIIGRMPPRDTGSNDFTDHDATRPEKLDCLSVSAAQALFNQGWVVCSGATTENSNCRPVLLAKKATKHTQPVQNAHL